MTADRSSIRAFALAFALIAGFSALAVSSAFFSGVPYGNDLTQHYQFAATIHESFSRGEIYPSLSASANRGMGDYGIRFYPPLGYYALAGGHALAGDWFNGSILAFFLIYLAGGVGVYLWVKEGFSETQSLIAAALYVFAPYHLNQIYNNFLYGEFAASAVVPFCFLFLHRTAEKPRPGSAAGLAAVYGLLILTHLPSMIFCSISFGVYGLVVMTRSGTWKKALPYLAGAVGTAIAATSIYWVKLVTELDWINHSKQEYFSNTWDYANNFLLRPSNLLNIRDDVLAIWMGDLMLAAAILISLPTAAVLWRQKERLSPMLLGSLVTMLVAVFFASVISKPVWDSAGFLQKIQFPWRWMGVVSVTAAVFASYGIASAAGPRKQVGPAMSVILVAGLVAFTVSAVFITKQSVFIPPGEFTAEKVDAMLRAPSRDCWWTVWASEGFYRDTPAGPPRGKIVSRSSLEIEAVVPGSGEVEFPVLFYPHWRAYAGEKRLETGHNAKGLLIAAVPPGTEKITLRFREPDIVRAAAVASASGLAAIMFVWLIPLVRRTFFKGNKKAA